jgi:hypothetical protein
MKIVLVAGLLVAAEAAAFGSPESLMIRLVNKEDLLVSGGPADLTAAAEAVAAAKQKILAEPLIGGDTSLLGVDMELESEADLVNRFVAAVHTQKPFVISFGGSSVTAGHDNVHKDAYPQVMADFLGPAMAAAGSKLTVRNQAMGGTASTPWSLCLRNFLGDDTDLAVWEFSMIDAGNGGDGMRLKEYFVRNALSLPKQPAVLFVLADFPRRSEAKTTKGQTCRHQEPNSRDGCGVNMGLTKETLKKGLREGEASFTREMFEDYKVCISLIFLVVRYFEPSMFWLLAHFTGVRPTYGGYEPSHLGSRSYCSI